MSIDLSHARSIFPEAVKSNGAIERIQAFGQYLRDRGHATSTTQSYIRCAEHFERWFGSAPEGAGVLGEPAVALFIKDHLPSCTCSSSGQRGRKQVRAALHRFLTALQTHHFIQPLEPPILSDVEKELLAFDRYLTDTCGAARETRIYRLRYVREFLRSRFGEAEVNAHSLKPQEIMSYMAERATRCKPGTAKVIATSVRSYLKFLVLRGLASSRLAASVPTIPQWRLYDIPKILTSTELNRFLFSFDVSTATGRRNYAMALCFAELGLRTCEVAALRLDDINWREGTVRIVEGKSRERLLPLTPQIGDAIADYLKAGRPKSTERVLFLRHSVPAEAPVTCHVVRGAVRRACARVGIFPPRDGPHTLRHTLATRLLQSGVPLPEVADVLGHQTIDTTAIYTKVDLPSLVQVAMPWPEVTS